MAATTTTTTATTIVLPAWTSWTFLRTPRGAAKTKAVQEHPGANSVVGGRKTKKTKIPCGTFSTYLPFTYDTFFFGGGRSHWGGRSKRILLLSCTPKGFAQSCTVLRFTGISMYKQQAIPRTDSFYPQRKKWNKWCRYIWYLHAWLKRGRHLFWRKQKKTKILGNPKIMKKSQLWGQLWTETSLVGSLMWPWEVFGQLLILLGCSAFWQILICRPPCTSRFLILISSSNSAQMLSLKFLNSLNLRLTFLKTTFLIEPQSAPFWGHLKSNFKWLRLDNGSAVLRSRAVNKKAVVP